MLIQCRYSTLERSFRVSAEQRSRNICETFAMKMLGLAWRRAGGPAWRRAGGPQGGDTSRRIGGRSTAQASCAAASRVVGRQALFPAPCGSAGFPPIPIGDQLCLRLYPSGSVSRIGARAGPWFARDAAAQLACVDLLARGVPYTTFGTIRVETLARMPF